MGKCKTTEVTWRLLGLGWATRRLNPLMACICMTHELRIAFTNGVYKLVHLHIASGCFGTTTAELNSCDRDSIALKAQNIYSLALYRTSLLMPAQNPQGSHEQSPDFWDLIQCSFHSSFCLSSSHCSMEFIPGICLRNKRKFMKQWSRYMKSKERGIEDGARYSEWGGAGRYDCFLVSQVCGTDRNSAPGWAISRVSPRP